MDLDVKKEVIQEETANKKETWTQPNLYELNLDKTLGGKGNGSESFSTLS